MFLKLFRKLTSQVLHARFWIAKLSPLNLISTFCHMKLEFIWLDFFNKLHQCLQRKNRSIRKILPELTSLREPKWLSHLKTKFVHSHSSEIVCILQAFICGVEIKPKPLWCWNQNIYGVVFWFGDVFSDFWVWVFEKWLWVFLRGVGCRFFFFFVELVSMGLLKKSSSRDLI